MSTGELHERISTPHATNGRRTTRSSSKRP